MDGWQVEMVDQQRIAGTVPRTVVDVFPGVDGGRLAVDGQDLVHAGRDGHERWRYRCTGRPSSAHVSGDRLLVLTHTLDYHSWGYLGPALLLDVGNGRLLAELRGERGTSLGGGRFLLGLEGYGLFDTRLHGRDGTLLSTWPSYGHYLPDPDGTVRVVECDRTIPTSSRVVRLLPEGGIEHGPGLLDSQVPPPVVLPDGTAVVLDAGVLRAFGRDLDAMVLAELLPVAPSEAWRFDGRLALEGDRLTITVQERSAEVPINYTTRQWILAVRKRS